MKRKAYIFLLSVAAVISSCSPKVASGHSEERPVIFPDYIGVTVPVNIAPMNFMVIGADYVRADFSCGRQALGTVTGRTTVDIPAGKWGKWLHACAGEKIDITLSVWNPSSPDGVTYQPFSIYVSPDTIDGYISYRLIEPGYESWQDIGIYQRNLSTFDEKAIVTNRQNHGGCLNCHSYNNYDPGTMLFHARGAGGGTVIWKDGKVKKVDMTETNLKMKGVYPMWHRDGRYVVFSSNSTSQSFYNTGSTPIEVYDMESDIFIYDTETGDEIADPRFTEKTRLETFPAFSPDGRYLYMCSADSVDFDHDFWNLKYSVIRLSFNAADGSLGEEIDTVYNALTDGHSASFPRISPDGKYLLYTQADFATFPIWHREADLKMIDLESGEYVDISQINSDETESYHSWSSTGRWVVFSSRRLDSRYTRLFFSHIDADGHCTKPFLLPQKNPMENQYRIKSYNVPEYTLREATLPRRGVTNLF